MQENETPATSSDAQSEGDFSVHSLSQLSLATTTATTLTDLTRDTAATDTAALHMKPLPDSGHRYHLRPPSVASSPVRPPRPVSIDLSAAAQQLPADNEGGRERNRSSTSFLGASTTLVDEKHVNYVLMYDMLTGIRISVSRHFDSTVSI